MSDAVCAIAFPRAPDAYFAPPDGLACVASTIVLARFASVVQSFGQAGSWW